MERTRIVHYTHSRTPLILSPTSPTTTPPRLPSSSSMSSLVSGIDEKAPLASIDIDYLPAPRRSSKAGDYNGNRSSSTGRLIDDSEIGTSVYTALRCQDLPVPCDDSVDLRNGVHNGETTTRKERSRSDVTPPCINGNSPNLSMDAAMRRHTMGSWSKSRRKPQMENGNGGSSPGNSSTLPHRGSESTSSDTLVKSRRRYTWLSSKQSVSQGPTVTRPQNLDIVSGHLESQSDNSSTLPKPHPTIKSPLTPLRQQNGINGNHNSPDNSYEVSTFPRASNIKTHPLDQQNPSTDVNPELRHHNSFHGVGGSPKIGNMGQHRNSDPISKKDSNPSPKASPSRWSPSKHLRRNNDILVSPNTAKVPNGNSSDSPQTDPKAGSPNDYNWRSDPRRRPCNFITDFNLSPPQSPPEPEPATRYPPSLTCPTDTSNSRLEYSTPSTKHQLNGITPSPPMKRNDQSPTPILKMGCKSSPPAKRTETSFASKISTLFGSEKSYSSDSSINSYVNYGGPDDDLALEDKTPVNELDPLPLSQCLLDTTIGETDVNGTVSPFENYKDDKLDRSVQAKPQTSPKLQHQEPSTDGRGEYRDCLRRDSLQFIPTSGSIRTNGVDHDRGSLYKSSGSGRKFSYTKKSKSVSVCTGGAPSDMKSIEDILKSPRTRNSFKIAVGSNWDDVFPEVESLPRLPDISEDKALSPKRAIRRNTTSSEEDVFISCKNLDSNGSCDVGLEATISSDMSSDNSNNDFLSTHVKKVPLAHSTLIQEGQESENYDSLNRRIKRNSMRLATASLSDITCAIDDINIDIGDSIENSFSNQNPANNNELANDTKTSYKPSPIHMKSNLSRTGSLLSSQNGSSFGSFYSCQSNDTNSRKNSPMLSNGSHRKELRARLDSPLVSRPHNHYSNTLDTSFPSSTRTSSPVSVASSGRSSQRQRPAYYWTRQTPYPRLLYARSSSVASSRGSGGGYTASSPQPSTTSSIHTNTSHNSTAKKNTTDPNIGSLECSKTNHHQIEGSHEFTPNIIIDNQSSQQNPTNSNSTPRPIDRRSMTLPIPHPYYKFSEHDYTPYNPDLSPSSVLESPNGAVRSPPSLGRPKRKQYAGFDCQPLPMDSFMSDSSSVYTGVSCSSRATDMTGQPDNAQFDESFMSEDIRSCFTDESRGDISFDASETLQPSSLLSDIIFSKDMEENESKRGSIHSTSTTKQDNGGESSVEEKSRDDSISLHNTSDDFIENTNNDHLGIRQEKQFGSEYDALFRLYKTDDLFTTPSYSLYSQNGKAFSSSCLLRAQLYSKRKFLSTRDIFDLIKNSDKTRPDVTVSLTSLERHAHKVCEAILCCDEIDQGYINSDTHSLV